MRQPSLFVSHGSPTLALGGGAYGQALAEFARTLPEAPRAVLAISAHWQAPFPLRITTAARPGILHDFGGFPEELYRLDYPCLGEPALAREAVELLRAEGFDTKEDAIRKFDHGVWSVLLHAFPEADVPVVQVSLPPTEPARLAALGRALAPLRERGVLLLGTGGLVHNLRRVRWDAPVGEVEPWAREAEAWFLERLQRKRWEDLFRHRDTCPLSAQAAPTTEHLDPLFPVLGAAAEDDRYDSIFEGFQLGNLSLRCFAWMDPEVR